MKSEAEQKYWDEAYSLMEKAIEGDLSESEGARLNELVSTDADIRRAYLEYAHQHACLHGEGVSISEADNRDFVVALGGDRHSMLASGWMRWAVAIAASIAFLMLGFYGGTQNRGSEITESPVIATLIKAKGCSWGSGTLPTETDSQLRAGTINLVSGLATLRFVSGVEVTLEAPAEIELIDPMKCVLHDGTLVANVPAKAKGFIVDTDKARLVDQGTSFGVFVDRELGTTDVQVFDGIVDVEQRTTHQQQRMLAGERSIIDDHRFESPGTEMFESGRESADSAGDFEEATVITTADGKGRGGFVYPKKKKSNIHKPLLFVKSSIIRENHSRKTYLSFDLAALNGRLAAAKLQLQIQRSGKGYASVVPDSTFAVYGLTDESLDNWNAKELGWDNAPANQTGGAAVDSAKTRLLGRFVIPQGVYTGLVGIETSELVEFLRQDTNGIATFVVVRETLETRGGGLVHAFAGKNHPTGTAPTLLVLTDQP